MDFSLEKSGTTQAPALPKQQIVVERNKNLQYSQENRFRKSTGRNDVWSGWFPGLPFKIASKFNSSMSQPESNPVASHFPTDRSRNKASVPMESISHLADSIKAHQRFTSPTIMGNAAMSKEELKKLEKQLEKMRASEDPFEVPKYQFRVADLQTGKMITNLDLSEKVPPGASKQMQLTIAGMHQERHNFIFSRDAKLLAIKDSEQQIPVVRIYETVGSLIIRSIPLSRTPVLTDSMDPSALIKSGPRWYFAFSPDNKTLATHFPGWRLPGETYGYCFRTSHRYPSTSTARRCDRVQSQRYAFSHRCSKTEHKFSGIRKMESKPPHLIQFPAGFTVEWLVTTPDGLFDRSPSAFGEILWRFSPSTFDVAPLEAFFNEMYYPGLLSEIWAGKNSEGTP